MVGYRTWWIVADYVHKRADVVQVTGVEDDARLVARSWLAKGAFRVRLFGRDPASGDCAAVATWIDMTIPKAIRDAR